MILMKMEILPQVRATKTCDNLQRYLSRAINCHIPYPVVYGEPPFGQRKGDSLFNSRVNCPYIACKLRVCFVHNAVACNFMLFFGPLSLLCLDHIGCDLLFESEDVTMSTNRKVTQRHVALALTSSRSKRGLQLTCLPSTANGSRNG